MKPLKIVTFNLRLDTPYDGEQAFPHRAGYVVDRIKEEKPDIIGFQEVLPHVLTFLKENMTGYTLLGYGRGADFGDEANPIAFRTDRFELQYFDQRGLSDTPFIPGSRFAEQSGCPRVFCAAGLRDLEPDGAGRFRFLNTHLDHEKEYAQREGMKQILAYIDRLNAELKLPAVLTGDFNAYPDSAPLALVYAAGMRDLASEVKETFHGYGRLKKPCKIDYIIADNGVVSSGAYAWTGTRDGLYLSDHNPVCVYVENWGK